MKIVSHMHNLMDESKIRIFIQPHLPPTTIYFRVENLVYIILLFCLFWVGWH